MYDKKLSFAAILVLSILLLISPVTKAEASEDKEPDKIEVVDIDPSTLYFYGDKYLEEEFYQTTGSWDITKDIQVAYGNLCFHALLSKDNNSSWIYRVDQIESQTLGELVFPETIQEMPVSKIGPAFNHGDYMTDIWGHNIEPYHDYDNYRTMPHGIKKIQLPSTVTDIVMGTFCGFQDLTSIKIPDGVTDIAYATFYNCTKLKKVVFPANLETFDFTAFIGCDKLDTIKISKRSKNYICKQGMLLSKNGKTVAWIQPAIKKLVIPEGVKTIGQGASLYSNVTTISLPRSLTTIQKLGLNGNKITSITISSKNKKLAKSGNCIYDKKTNYLVAVLCKNGTITLPKQVQYLDENISIAGKRVEKLIIPKTFKGIKARCFQNEKLDFMDVYFKSKTPPTAEKDAFGYHLTYIVPKGCLEIYQEWYYTTNEIQEGYKCYIDFEESK